MNIRNITIAGIIVLVLLLVFPVGIMTNDQWASIKSPLLMVSYCKTLPCKVFMHGDKNKDFDIYTLCLDHWGIHKGSCFRHHLLASE